MFLEIPEYFLNNEQYLNMNIFRHNFFNLFRNPKKIPIFKNNILKIKYFKKIEIQKIRKKSNQNLLEVPKLGCNSTYPN